MDKEKILKDLKEIKESLDNLYEYLNEVDYDELREKVLNKYIKSNEKYMRHLTEECIKITNII
jgi:hypothetical protein